MLFHENLLVIVGIHWHNCLVVYEQVMTNIYSQRPLETEIRNSVSSFHEFCLDSGSNSLLQLHSCNAYSGKCLMK